MEKNCAQAKKMGARKGLKGYNFRGSKGSKPLKDTHLHKSKERK